MWINLCRMALSALINLPSSASDQEAGGPQGRFDMSALSDSYVARVLFATHRPAGALDAIARRWRWLRDPYRPELHYMRGPGPKWREKHGR